jgi:hypothetical protein
MPDDPLGPGPSEEDLAEWRDAYEQIAARAFDLTVGDSATELTDSARQAIMDKAGDLADQLGRSILYNPGVRADILTAVQDWISSGETLDFNDLRARLEPLVGTWRALMIGRTETAQVWAMAQAAGMRSIGIELCQWIAGPGACEECQALADENGGIMTVSDFENNFPVHPNDGCNAVPVEQDDMSGGEPLTLEEGG